MSDCRKILIADDLKEGRDLMKSLLKVWGYQVVEAQNGLESLQMLDDPDICLALLDWNMPKMEGVEVCRRVREDVQRHYTYIILVTARSEKQDMITALEAGADDYITKPFDQEELRSRIKAGERIIDLERRLATKIEELEQTLSENTELKQLIPICSYCKRIRDDKDYWHQLEAFLHHHKHMDFSHSICPDCIEKYIRPQLDEEGWKGLQVRLENLQKGRIAEAPLTRL